MKSTFLNGYQNDIINCKFNLLKEEKLKRITKSCPLVGTSIEDVLWDIGMKVARKSVKKVEGTIHSGLKKSEILNFTLKVKQPDIDLNRLSDELQKFEFFSTKFFEMLFSASTIKYHEKFVEFKSNSLLQNSLCLKIQFRKKSKIKENSVSSDDTEFSYCGLSA